MQFFYSESTDPAYNLALEEYILTEKKEDFILLWQNANTIVIGKNQNAEEEINRSFIEEHDILVVRRTTGGGAVYHDMGNLNFSFITAYIDKESSSMEYFTGIVADVLKKMNVPAKVTGRNDIVVEGKKVSGNAQRIFENRILHHGTLLFQADMAKVAGALHVREDKLAAKGVSSVASRVGNIGTYLPGMEMKEFIEILQTALLTGKEVREWKPSAEDIRKIIQLADNKYRTTEWNFGKSPMVNKKKRARFAQGELEIYMMVKEDKILSADVYGDFLSLRSTVPLKEALTCCMYDREKAKEALLNINVRYGPGYFEESLGGITINQVLELLFDGN